MLVFPNLSDFVERQCPLCGARLSAPDLPDDAHCLDCELKRLDAIDSEAERTRRQRACRAKVLTAADCPSRFSDEPFDDTRIPGGWPRHNPRLHPAKARVDLRTWAGRPHSSLVIAGEIGAGKTMLATELLWRAFQRGQSLLWIRADDLVDRVYGTRDRKIYRRVTRSGAVLIDDLGCGHSGEAWNLLDRVVAARHQDQRQTIVTLHGPFAKGPDSLYQRAPAIADRLTQGLFVRLSTDRGSQRGHS